MKCTLIRKGTVFLGAESSAAPWGGCILLCLAQGTLKLSSPSSFPVHPLLITVLSPWNICLCLSLLLACWWFYPPFPACHDLSHGVRESHKPSSLASHCLAQRWHALKLPKPSMRGQERGKTPLPTTLLFLQCSLSARGQMDPCAPAQ